MHGQSKIDEGTSTYQFATTMTYQLFLACLDDTTSKVMGNVTVVSESSAIGCHVVHPVRKKRVPEDVVCSVE